MSFNTTFALWPILPLGAEENNEGENNNNNAENNPSGQGNSSQNNQNQNNGGDGSDDKDDPYKGLTPREIKRLLAEEEAKRVAAETERDDLKGKQTKAERDKLDKEERLATELGEANETVSNLRVALAEQAIINGILSDRRYEWHNPNIVAQQLDPEKVKVDDKGKVTGLEKALTSIAAGEGTKHLLAKDNTQENSNNQQQQQNNGNGSGPTGFQPGQGGAGSGESNGFTDSDLAKNYTALASRL